MFYVCPLLPGISLLFFTFGLCCDFNKWLGHKKIHVVILGALMVHRIISSKVAGEDNWMNATRTQWDHSGGISSYGDRGAGVSDILLYNPLLGEGLICLTDCFLQKKICDCTGHGYGKNWANCVLTQLTGRPQSMEMPPLMGGWPHPGSVGGCYHCRSSFTQMNWS